MTRYGPIIEARDVAKLFGGKALTGTQKQKAWGEKIRANLIGGMTEQQAVMACEPSGLGRSARFWIENRDKKPSEIGAFFELQKKMLGEAIALREAGKASEYADAAEAYNKLTENWGFTS